MSFKKCPYCGTDWVDFVAFLNDKDLVVTGYHANPDKVEDGVVLVAHDCDTCGGTIGVRVKKLADVYDVTRFDKSLYGTDVCEDHCPNYTDLEACDNECSMRWVRDVIQLVRTRTPSPGPTPGVM